MARRAGIQQASKAIAASRITTIEKVMASVGGTPTSRLAMARVPANESTKPERQANANDDQALLQYHHQDVSWLGSQGHANSDFMRTLRGCIRDDAVDSHYRQDQAQQTHRGRQLRTEAEKEKSVDALQGLQHRLHFFRSNIGCECVQVVFNIALQFFWRQGSSHVNDARIHVRLAQWQSKKRV